MLVKKSTRRRTCNVETRYGMMTVFSDDTICSRALIEYGEWAYYELTLLDGIIADDAVVFDVGAYIGTHARGLAPTSTIDISGYSSRTVVIARHHL